MPIGWGQENVINSEIDHAWAVEWMRLAGSSLYTYTVCTYSIKGRFFYCGRFFLRILYSNRNSFQKLLSATMIFFCKISSRL
jgi:hypothetical protein